jgi:hypothetical protein
MVRPARVRAADDTGLAALLLSSSGSDADSPALFERGRLAEMLPTSWRVSDVPWSHVMPTSVVRLFLMLLILGLPAALATAQQRDLAPDETATAAQVTPPDDPDAFRHRLTISVLWGIDNQFSGKMIEAANGTTTGGAPIRLDETTFDEVYGRMGLFKIGAGYRLSPRSEIAVNLVISRSSSETANIGTVTAANVPLYVDFEDYNYWGFEGGQRFFFARVRFTPYVGYLVGLNRFDDIRGTFVNVPASATPGLVAQDGKFFEKSWAFSFGPIGGVLIGLGPIEVMAETQLRFMGGLSDVDWLVEEGLRDINSESSRWSLPILIGARIRF